MRAAQYFGIRDVRIIVDVPEPIAKDNEAIVSVAWSGICGSDLHEYEMGDFSQPLSPNNHANYKIILGPLSIPNIKPHPLTNKTLPITLGHEFCGTIKSAPKNSALKPGQTVVADPRLLCRNCVRCNAHQSNSCSSLGFKGLSGDGGGFSDEVAIDADFLYPIPEETLPYAALIEPLAVAWHAVKVPHAPTYAGAAVLILGGGPIGVALTFVLRHFGANRIFISEPTRRRREQNIEIADEVFDPLSQSVVELCMEKTSGVGVDFVFDAAGSSRALADGVGAVKMRGTIVIVALHANVSQPFLRHRCDSYRE